MSTFFVKDSVRYQGAVNTVFEEEEEEEET